MEGEEGGRGIGCKEAFASRRAVDNVPETRLGGVERGERVNDIAVVDEGEATVGEVGTPNTENDMVWSEEEGVQVSNWSGSNGGKDGGLGCGGRDTEDTVC